MTFSIAGLCRRSGQFGCALATSSMAAGGRAPFVAPGTGVVLSQARSDPRLGELGLKSLASGRSAQQALADMAGSTPYAEWRQLAVLDRSGGVAFFTGSRCTDAKGGQAGQFSVAVGNGLGNARVVPAMLDGFESVPDAPLAERLLVALEHGERAGGEALPLRSAAVLVAFPDVPFVPINLRVDLADDPIAELHRMVRLWLPMVDGYIQRCMDPDNSLPAAAIEGHGAPQLTRTEP